MSAPVDVLAVMDAQAYAAELHVAGSTRVAQSERDNPRSHPHVAELYAARNVVAELIQSAQRAQKALPVLSAMLNAAGLAGGGIADDNSAELLTAITNATGAGA